MRHFEYLHSSVMDILLPFVKFRWSMKTKNAADSDFYEVMKHSDKSVAEFQYKLFRKYLESDPTRKAILNVLSLDAEIIFFNKWHFYFLTATGFQVLEPYYHRLAQQQYVYMFAVSYSLLFTNKPFSPLISSHRKCIILYGLIQRCHIGCQHILYMGS